MRSTISSAADRKLARKHAELRYDQLCLDLSNFEPGLLSAEVTAPPTATWIEARVGNGLPPLDLPLGDIAYHDHPERLPVIGIRLPAAPDPACLSALAAFFAEHRAHPFLRPVFLLSGYELLPLLGRYGFAYQVVGAEDDPVAFEYLQTRFGMIEVRDLIGARPVWKSSLA